jgi:hypothetical protein
MPDTDLHQPALGPLRTAAEAAVPAGIANGRAGIAVCWTADNLVLLDWDRCGTCTCTRQAMNTALGGVVHLVMPFGSAGAWLVTGHCGQYPGAGR